MGSNKKLGDTLTDLIDSQVDLVNEVFRVPTTVARKLADAIEDTDDDDDTSQSAVRTQAQAIEKLANKLAAIIDSREKEDKAKALLKQIAEKTAALQKSLGGTGQ